MDRIRKRVKGFTLIELLIVIAVIAILVALAVPNILSSRKRGNEARAQSKLKEIATAMATYRDRWGNGQYPNDICSLVNSGMSEKTGLSFSGTCASNSVTEAGYTFKVVQVQNPSNRFIVTAIPVSSTTADFAYAVAEDNKIYQNANGSSATDPSEASVTGIDTSGDWKLTGAYASGG